MRQTFGKIARHPVTAYAVLAIGIVLSAITAHQVANHVEREAKAQFDSAVTDAQHAIEARIHVYSDVLLGVRGLFIASDDVTPGEFRDYIDSLDLNRRYPGIQAINYGQRIPAAQKQAFEESMRKDTSIDPRGHPDFRIKPAGDRPEYVVVRYIEPMAGNEAALGLDLCGDAVRLETLLRTRDSSRLTASGIIALALDPQKHPGFAMRLPVYRKGMPVATVAQRREAFTGAVSAAFIVIDLMRGVLSEPFLQKIRVRIHDAGFVDRPLGSQPPAENLMFDSDRLLAAPLSRPAAGNADTVAFAVSSKIVVGGRRWDLLYSAGPEFLGSAERWEPPAALLGGIIISLLLFGLIRSLATSNSRAVKLADRITENLRRSEASVAEAQRVTQQLIEALPNPIFFKERGGRYLGVNRAWEELFGVSRESFIGKSVHDLYPDNPEVAALMHAKDQALWNNPGTQTYETTITTALGRRHDVIYYKATFTRADGRVAGLIGTIIDISERKQVEKRQMMEHAVTRVLAEAETSGEAIPRIIRIICESLEWACGAYWQWNADAQALQCAETWHVDAPEIVEFMAATALSFNEAPSWTGDAPPPHTGGLVRRVWHERAPVWFADVTREHGFRRGQNAEKAGLHCAFAFPVLDGAEPLGVMEFFGRDIEQPDVALLQVVQAIGSQVGQFIRHRQAEERVRHLAHYDELTGLPNRSMFNQRLVHALAKAKRGDRQLAVLFIDLDRFKNINDTLGHEAGDRVLEEVAERLRGCLRESDTVGRLGGDEFVVLIEESPELLQVASVAQKILAATARPFVVEGQEFHITASIGVSTYPDDSADMQSLLKNADIAMYRAKERGKNNYQFYSSQMNVHTLERVALESNLRRALERDEFLLHYQPKVDIASGRITGMEALVRWQQPGKHLISPMQFIPLAEETGLIVQIGEWVLATACACTRSWQEPGQAPLRVAVNLSPRQFAHERLLLDISQVLDDTGLDPSSLELEITEGMVMHNPELAAKLLTRLKHMGIRISIDDFGTGYSSLNYLKRFPLDSLKIDRSFIQDLPGNSDDAAITRAIIAMAHSLRLKVIAEGVETGEQLEFLREHGCDEMQGYYFSRPLPEDEFALLLLQGAGSRVAG